MMDSLDAQEWAFILARTLSLSQSYTPSRPDGSCDICCIIEQVEDICP